MKAFLLLLVGVLGSGCVLAEPAASKFTVRVIDVETGLPVTNAMVQSIFEHQYDPWGNKPSIVDRRKEPVDLNGEVVFKGKCIHGGAGGTVFAEGYYSSHAGKSLDKNLVLNRWEPWNPMVEVKMRPKKNPVPMLHKSIQREDIPAWDEPVGFDLEIGDWVAPHGKGGKCDFVFTASKVTEPKDGIQYAIVFSNSLDGLVEYVPPEGMHSSYIFPYKAPVSGYISTFSRYRLLKYPVLPNYPANNLKEGKDINYIFRVRTEANDEGEITSANYGRIKGEIRVSSKGEAYFSYYFNPDPQSRSLECNGVNLLKK